MRATVSLSRDQLAGTGRWLRCAAKPNDFTCSSSINAPEEAMCIAYALHLGYPVRLVRVKFSSGCQAWRSASEQPRNRCIGYLARNCHDNHESCRHRRTKFKPLRTWIPFLILPLMVVARFVPDFWADGPSWTWPSVPSFRSCSASDSWHGGYCSAAQGTMNAVRLRGYRCHTGRRASSGAHFDAGPRFMVMTIPMTVAAFAMGTLLFGSLFNAQSYGRIAGLSRDRCVCIVVCEKRRRGGAIFHSTCCRVWSKSADQLSRKSRDRIVHSRFPTTKLSSRVGPAHSRTVARWSCAVVRSWTRIGTLIHPKSCVRIAVGPAWSSFVSANKFLSRRSSAAKKKPSSVTIARRASKFGKPNASPFLRSARRLGTTQYTDLRGWFHLRLGRKRRTGQAESARWFIDLGEECPRRGQARKSRQCGVSRPRRS